MVPPSPGWLCWLALRCSDFWDWVDKRDLDKHALAWLVALCGWDLTWEAWDFAKLALNAKTPMAEVAATIAAIGVPYGLFATAVTKWYFERQD